VRAVALAGTGESRGKIMTVKYAIRCTPGGLLKDESTSKTIYFETYIEAETEAQRLTQEAYSNPRVAGFDFTPVEVDTEDH
jgi:hypothetical protein